MMQKRSACIRGEKCVALTFKARLNCALHHNANGLTGEEIADKAEVQYSRLKSYASESQPNDHIPFRALVRVCRVTGRWDLIDSELAHDGFHLQRIDGAAHTGKPLFEAVDVVAEAGRLLELIRDISKDDKVDAVERARAHDVIRRLRDESEQLERALDGPPHLRAV